MTRQQFILHVNDSQRELRRFLVALCGGDSYMADDIAQETYIKAYMSSESFANPEKFNAWIFRIAYTTFLNHIRSQRTYASIDEVASVSSDDVGDAAFRYQDLHMALDHLSDKERVSILLYYMEGYDVNEISEIVGASPEAVRQHLSRGRQHLRGLLSNHRSIQTK